MSEIPSHYPPTAFIEHVVGDLHPLGIDIVRAIYLAPYFAQGDERLTSIFAGMATHEYDFWLPYERPLLSEINHRVDRFFETGGALCLAEATFGDDEISSRNQMRAINRSWRTFRERSPSPGSLEGKEPFHEKLRDQPVTNMEMLKTIFTAPPLEEGLVQGIRNLKTSVAITRQFIHADINAINTGRPEGTYAYASRESLFREAVLAGRPTGSAAFNDIFSVMQDLAIGKFISPELRELDRVWCQYEKEAAFIPEAYEVARDSRPLVRRVSAALQRGLSHLIPS